MQFMLVGERDIGSDLQLHSMSGQSSGVITMLKDLTRTSLFWGGEWGGGDSGAWPVVGLLLNQPP